jgi:hypothetical protein
MHIKLKSKRLNNKSRWTHTIFSLASRVYLPGTGSEPDRPMAFSSTRAFGNILFNIPKLERAG